MVLLDLKKSQREAIANLLLFLVSVIFAVAIAELGARLLYNHKYVLADYGLVPEALLPDMQLDEYELPSEKSREHWVLKPGYRSQIEVFIPDREEFDRIRSVRLIKERVGDETDNSLVETLRINSHGFIGGELDSQHKLPRVLMLGDSVTFGSGSRRYPDYTEGRLEELQTPAEIVNGGVEGYAIQNLEYEFDRYVAVEPDVVTIMIGWNDLFKQVPWTDDIREISRLFWLVERAYRVLLAQFRGEILVSNQLRFKELEFDSDSEKVESLKDYYPPAISKIEALAKRFSANGMQVCLITIPSLLSMDMNRTAKLKSLAHVPYFTNNPYVVAKLQERFNAELKAVARRNDMLLFDAAAWSRQNMIPVEDYYLDSVHLTDDGLEKLGRALAESLSPIISRLMRAEAGS